MLALEIDQFGDGFLSSPSAAVKASAYGLMIERGRNRLTTSMSGRSDRSDTEAVFFLFFSCFLFSIFCQNIYEKIRCLDRELTHIGCC